MSTNSLDRSIKRRTLLKAGLALGALQYRNPRRLKCGHGSKEVWAGSNR